MLKTSVPLTRRRLCRAVAMTALSMSATSVLPARSELLLASETEIRNRFLGRWRYRSFRNIAEKVSKLEEILFWEAELVLKDGGPDRLIGGIGDDQDRLSIKGYATFGLPNIARFEAIGIDGTSTAGWKYNYSGFFVPDWPDGLEQKDAIVGSVVRTLSHSDGKAKAGYTASFVAVRLN